MFVLSTVISHYGEKISSVYELGVFLSFPIDMGLERVERRPLEQYGEHVLVVDDMYKQEQGVLELVRSRDLPMTDEWVKTLTCPILHFDDAKAISDNIHLIMEKYSRTK